MLARTFSLGGKNRAAKCLPLSLLVPSSTKAVSAVNCDTMLLRHSSLYFLRRIVDTSDSATAILWKFPLSGLLGKTLSTRG